MVRAIIRCPRFVTTTALKCVGAAVTFMLVMYCYATGQVVRTEPVAQGADTPGQGIGKTTYAVPMYGVPEYGIMPLYGVPVRASYTVTGAIRVRQAGDGNAIAGIQVTLRAPNTNTVLATDTTDAQGAFSLYHETYSLSAPQVSTWVLRAVDVDGILNNGLFEQKDTTVTILSQGYIDMYGNRHQVGTTSVDMLLDKADQVAARSASPARTLCSRLSVSNDQIHFTLAEGGHIHLRAYNAAGALVGDFLDENRGAGDHAIPFDRARMPAGALFFRLDGNGISRITKVMLH